MLLLTQTSGPRLYSTYSTVLYLLYCTLTYADVRPSTVLYCTLLYSTVLYCTLTYADVRPSTVLSPIYNPNMLHASFLDNTVNSATTFSPAY